MQMVINCIYKRCRPSQKPSRTRPSVSLALVVIHAEPAKAFSSEPSFAWLVSSPALDRNRRAPRCQVSAATLGSTNTPGGSTKCEALLPAFSGLPDDSPRPATEPDALFNALIHNLSHVRHRYLFRICGDRLRLSFAESYPKHAGVERYRYDQQHKKGCRVCVKDNREIAHTFVLQ